MRFAFIEQHASTWPVRLMCRVLDVSASGYCDWRSRPEGARSFIREIGDPDTAAIVRAVVGLGARLGTAITAEGVETEAQLELVRTEGCTEVQGFLFSRPLPAEHAPRFIPHCTSERAA